ncbi:MAG TPA: TonB-dependent receptor [Parvibaculum sp.]
MNNSTPDGRRLSAAALGFAALLAGPAFAADTAVTTPELLITAGAEPLPTKEATSSYTIITAEQIATHQYRTLTDALHGAPGTNVVQSGGRGTAASVFTRGMNSNHTLFLLNGQPISDPSSSNGAFNLASFTLENVERIEIVRGPQSALYGSQAIGGVINIITKTGGGAPQTTARVEVGTLGSINTSATSGGSFGKTNYFFSAARQATDGNDITPERLRFGADKEQDNAENVNLSAHFDTALSDNLTASFFTQYNDSRSDLDEGGYDALFTAVYEDLNDHSRTRQFSASGDIAGRFMDGRWRPKLKLSYTRYATKSENFGDALLPDISGEVNDNSERIDTSLDNVFDVTDSNTFSLSGNYSHEEFVENGFRDFGGGYIQYPDSSAQTHAYALAASDRQTFGARFFATVSARYDMPANFDDRFSYTIAPGYYQPETDTRLTASYGTGFKVPSLYQRFGFSPYSSSFGPGAYIGNPDLKAEKSKGWDVGIEQGLFDDLLRTGATWFHNDVQDGIVVVYPTATTSTSVNTQAFKTHGVEAFVEANPFASLTARIDYTFTIVDANTIEPQLRRPRHQVDFTTAWSVTEATTISADVLWVGQYMDVLRDGVFPNLYGKQAGYSVTNIAVSHKLSKAVELTAKVNNLFNRDYEPANGFAAPGIEALAGVAVTF